MSSRCSEMFNKMVIIFIVFSLVATNTEQNVQKKKNLSQRMLMRPIFQHKNLQVQTTNGLVRGKVSKTVRLGTTFYSFQGIPFAKKPTGNLRFADPEPADNWAGVLDATTEKDICSQMSTPFGSEDCLYLNIYTTMLPRGNNIPLLPVMIWIHGGAFIEGGSLYRFTKPDYILDQNVVYASVQYRLGIFGFLSTGDEVISGNFGLKDQVMAIKWIHENVHAFGGNPNKMTIFGESAGSVSVAYLSQMPQLNGILSGVIMQSGSSLAQWSLIRDPKKGALAYANLMGIKSQNSTVILNKLRRKSANQLRSVAGISSGSQFIFNNWLLLPFGPVIEKRQKTAVITETSYPLLQRGKFNRIPHLIGFNSEEGKALLVAAPAIEMATSTFDSDPKNYVPFDMNVKQELEREVGEKIRDHYSTYPTNLHNKIRFITDTFFIRPARKQVQLVRSRVPTYFYKFAYEGNFMTPFGVENIPGVPHAQDVDYFFGKNLDYVVSKKDMQTRLKLVRLWTNFAKYGNPTPKPDPLLDNAVWPAVTSDTEIAYLLIDYKLENKTNPNKGDMAFWDGIYAEYSNPPYGTYK